MQPEPQLSNSTNNCYPFTMETLGGLTPLTAWLLNSGIVPEHTNPGCLQKNGQHERMPHAQSGNDLNLNLVSRYFRLPAFRHYSTHP